MADAMVEGAVSRRTVGGEVGGGAEAVTREEALRMMTIDAAALSFEITWPRVVEPSNAT